jgi:hypothetical protein
LGISISISYEFRTLPTILIMFLGNLTPSKIVSAKDLREMLSAQSSSGSQETPPAAQSRQTSNLVARQHPPTAVTASAAQEQQPRLITRDPAGPGGLDMNAAKLHTTSRPVIQSAPQHGVLPASNVLASMLQSSKSQAANDYFNSVLQGHSVGVLRGNTNPNSMSGGSPHPAATTASTNVIASSGKAPASKSQMFSVVKFFVALLCCRNNLRFYIV